MRYYEKEQLADVAHRKAFITFMNLKNMVK